MTAAMRCTGCHTPLRMQGIERTHQQPSLQHSRLVAAQAGNDGAQHRIWQVAQGELAIQRHGRGRLGLAKTIQNF